MADQDQTDTSKHLIDGEVVEIERTFTTEQIDAGYNEITFGEPATADSDLIGDHDGIAVAYVAVDPTVGGPVFTLTDETGLSITVLCADVVRGYLNLSFPTLEEA